MAWVGALSLGAHRPPWPPLLVLTGSPERGTPRRSPDLLRDAGAPIGPGWSGDGECGVRSPARVTGAGWVVSLRAR